MNMILNIVTNTPDYVLEDLYNFWATEWNITYLGEVAKGIHEYSMVPKEEGRVLSIENLLELGYTPWNLRIR